MAKMKVFFGQRPATTTPVYQVYVGSVRITDMYVGSTKVTTAYVGSTVIKS